MLPESPKASLIPDPSEPDELTRLVQELARPEVKRNPQRRIEICRRALALNAPEQQAHRHELQKELGDALFLDRSASRPESLEEAIGLLWTILDEDSPVTPPLFRARVLESLGNALRNRLRGPRANNVEEAIGRYREALSLLDRERDSFIWALLQGSLGMAWSERIRGDRAENLELARAAYLQALEIFTRERFPIEWAVTVHNLANVLRDRLRGSREDNLEEAIRLYEESLEIRTREANAVQWAMTLHNLAIAYRRRLRSSPAGNVDRAISLSLQALEVRTREDAPLRWAQTQCTLGNAWAERPHEDPAANLRHAREAYESALEVMTPESSPFQAATLLRNLGKILGLLLLTHGEGTAEEALAVCRAALDIHQAATAPHDHREAADILGTIHFGLAQWKEAADAFASASEAGEILYQAGSTPDSRNAELREGRDLASRAAYALARSGRLAEAVETLERSRTRALSEALALDEARLEAAREEHRTAFRESREQIRALEAEARDAGAGGARSFLTVSSELRTTRARLAELVRDIRHEIPDFLEEGLSFSGICRLATTLDRPLVQLMTSGWGSLALIVPPGSGSSGDVQAVWIDHFSQGDLERLLFRGDHPLLGGEEPDTEPWKATLDAVCTVSAERLMSPLAESLQSLGFERAILCPAGHLSPLPLHAVVADRVLFTAAPSAHLLQTSIARSRERQDLLRIFLGVGTGAPGEPLPFATREIGAAGAHFPENRRRQFLDGSAVRRTVFPAMAGVSHLHFACHGTFDPSEPLQSALHLAQEDRITLRDILDDSPDLSAARLAILSACRSGLAEYQNTPDEALGFPAVLLQAGIPAVIATLWPVADLSSALLMGRFYEIHLGERRPAAVALRSAQRWLRDATAEELGVAGHAEELLATARTPTERAAAYQILRRASARPDLRTYAHPYYWAGYFLTGDPGGVTSP